jgi:hypothetical protein
LAGKQQIYENEEFSFIIQGIPTSITDITRNICFYYGNPIDASWNQEDLSRVRSEVLTKRYINNQNIYFQTVGTLNGLRKSTTKYVVKIRSDEWYHNLYPILQQCKETPDKIITNNVFARKISRFPFHMSDHIIAGTKENMFQLFETSKNNLERKILDGKCAEQHFAQGYLRSKGINILPIQRSEILDLTKKYFHIVSIRKMGAYRIVANSVYKYILSNENTDQYYRKFVDIESIDDM